MQMRDLLALEADLGGLADLRTASCATLRDMVMVDRTAAAGPVAPEVSRLVFGNSHMFGVMVEIASRHGEKFSSKQISDAAQLSPGIVHPLIQKLRRAQFIEFVEQVPGERTLLYRVCNNHVWEAASRYAEEREPPKQRSAS